jgi:hypothetical protein
MKSWISRVAVVIGATVAALAGPGAAQADPVLDWFVTARNAINVGVPAVGSPGFAAPPAHASTLSFAMVQGAVYDAVNEIDGGYERYLLQPAYPDRAGPLDSKDAAVAAAAYNVLKVITPSQLAMVQAKYDTAIGGIPDGLAKTRGVAAGEAAAQAMLDARANDGRMLLGEPYNQPLGDEAGEWRVSFPLTAVEPAWWVGDVQPFLVPDVQRLRTEGPNRLKSHAYAEDYNEVKSIGALNSTTRTADQTKAAIFWQTPPGFLWGELLDQLATKYSLDSVDRARLYAVVWVGMADAAIGCWNDKYYWKFWRPLDAIRNGDDDGNRQTDGDPSWLPLFDPSTPTVPALTTPNFPDHPSGHSCLTGSVVNNLEEFFGTDKIDVQIKSTRFPGYTRDFDRLSDVAKEVVDARVWGGIHFRTADEQGVGLGKKVARWESKHYFQRLR